MRYLIFSDIHSNLEALQSVLDDASDKNVDSIICLGDFVGYGADPGECVRAVSHLENMSAVLGNHDAAVLDPSQREFFNPVAHAGIIYSELHTDAEGQEFLRRLPLTIDLDFLCVHASPYRPEAWIYVLDPLEAADAFHAMRHTIAFIGHTHFPAIHTDDGLLSPFLPGDRVRLDTDKKMIINVGSVGQPRDGDPRACYVLFDTESQTAELFRVEYDVDQAAEKILKAGLPPMLADRLRRGY